MALELIGVTRRALRIKQAAVPKELHPELLARVRGMMADLEGRFVMWTGHRNKAMQQRAFREGRSQARWLESPHNYKPALACDLVLNPELICIPNARDPRYPDLWNNEEPEAKQAWRDLDEAAMDHHLVRIHLRFGKDLPHVELPGWRAYAR